MPFQSDRQRKYLWANKPEVAKQIAYKQEGGPLVPTAGLAAPSIAEYSAGPLGSPGISYTPGEAAAGQDALFNYERDRQELQDAGIDPTNIIYRDIVEPVESDRPEDTWANWNDKQRQRFLETGTSGELLSKDDRDPWRRGVNVLSPEDFAAEMTRRDEGGLKVPGISTAIMGGIGGAMRAKMRKAVEAGGTPIAINGQFAVLNPDGSVLGNAGPLGAQGVRDYGVQQGLIEAPETPSWLKNPFASVKEILGFKQEADAEAAAEAQRVAEERAAAQARLDIARRGGDPYRDESDDSFRDRTQAASSRIDWSAPSDADLEDVYGGTTDWNFKKGGYVKYKRGGGSIWGPAPVASSRVKEMPLAPAQIAQAQALAAQQGLLGQAKDMAAEKAIQFALSKALPFNKGGKVKSMGHENMTAGPLASVKYKKEGGKIKEEYERKYHNTKDNTHPPLRPTGGSNASEKSN